MASKDLHSNVAVSVSLAPAVRTADTNGTGVDLSKYESAEVIFNVGAEGVTLSGTDKIALELEESDDDVTYTDVAAADMIGEESAGTVRTLDDNAECPAVYRVGYIGSKRYVRAVLNFSGTHGTGTPIGCVVVAGHPRTTPTS